MMLMPSTTYDSCDGIPDTEPHKYECFYQKQVGDN